MKTFENYPHDPQRGNDLIAAPVLYKLISNKKYGRVDTSVRHVAAQNTVVHLPEPDFRFEFSF
jgi:hypothetical protein